MTLPVSAPPAPVVDAPSPVPTPPAPPVPAAVPPAVPAPLHDDPEIAKLLEGLSPEKRETLLTTGGRNALAARAQEVKDAKAAAATAAETAQAALAQTIGKALGLVKDEPIDPSKLTEQLTQADASAKQARTELAIFQAAATVNVDASALLDSRAFMTKIANIDPADGVAIAAAIGEAVTANPALAKTDPSAPRVPAPNPAQGTGGSGTPPASQLTKADVERMSREGKHSDIEKARLEGRLNTILGITPTP